MGIKTDTIHLYESILDAVNFPITVTNKDMEWIFINKAVEDFLGVKRENVIGKKCSSWNAHICNTENCGITRLRNGHSDTYFEQFNGKYHVFVSYLYDENGEISGHVEVVKDITEIVNMTEQQAKAETANRAKSDFLARVSHELRTPMNAILGITEMQMQNNTLPQETQEALRKMYDSGYMLLNIINDILDLSKIEAGKLEISPVRYDVASMINDTVHLNVVRYDSKPIKLNIDVNENMPSLLFGDELRIRQILNNLLSNAFKYTDKGQITLSVNIEKTTPLALNAQEQVVLVFSVSDTGQGMTSEQVNRLFDEYIRFNMEANRTTEGTGLGMSITKHIVSMMNGQIFVESEPGKGSVFTVRLPQGYITSNVIGKDLAENLKQFHLGRAMQMKKAPQIKREYMPYGRVLIVDDVESNLYVAKGLLAPYGLSIDTVTSGFSAVDKIKDGAVYDIVFMDHFMPKMDGIEAARIMREMGYTQPIIALTANALSGQAEIFLENGFDGFISKPIDTRQLNIMLNKLIRNKYPKEVIESARRLKENLDYSKTDNVQQSLITPQLKKIFIKDAEKAIAILEKAVKNKFESGDDVQLHVINVHAMKSALANIEETELSDFALKLEQTGRDENIEKMLAETPVFIKELRSVIEKISPKEEDEEDGEQDTNYNWDLLLEKLSVIKTSCESYNKKTAKNTLAELLNEKWPHKTEEMLDTVADHLLHSNFENVVKIAEDYIFAYSAQKTSQ